VQGAVQTILNSSSACKNCKLIFHFYFEKLNSWSFLATILNSQLLLKSCINHKNHSYIHGMKH